MDERSRSTTCGHDVAAVAAATALAGPPRLLCDEMLQGLGRWLRAAGYDTAIAVGGSPDLQVLARALAEDRFLLTCDRAMTQRRLARGRVVALDGGGMDANARELGLRLGIDWLHAPFTRCLRDNALLAPAGRAERARLPAKVLARGGPLTACPDCGRVYWPGSHLKRMRARLERWQRAVSAP